MAIFRRKSMLEKLDSELSTLRARVEMLTKRHAAAETALSTAKAALQRHHLECELGGADDKVRVKLEAAIASCALTRDGYADAIADVREKIGDAEQKLTIEKDRVRRAEASDALARDLDEIDAVLPDFLAITRRFVDAFGKVGHWHYESGDLSRFVSNCVSQSEVAAAFSLQELRGIARGIAEGSAPIPPSRSSLRRSRSNRHRPRSRFS
jgi:hypothetical protein